MHTPQLNNDTSSALGTIISPYFGPRVATKEETKVENQKDLLPKEEKTSFAQRITRKKAEELPISSLLAPRVQRKSNYVLLYWN